MYVLLGLQHSCQMCVEWWRSISLLYGSEVRAPVEWKHAGCAEMTSPPTDDPPTASNHSNTLSIFGDTLNQSKI